MRVNDNNMSSTLSDLLVIYNCDEFTRMDLYSIIRDNLHWIDIHTNDIRIFLNNFHHASISSSSSSFQAISHLIILFGLASNSIICYTLSLYITQFRFEG